MALIVVKKVIILVKYSSFINSFSKKLAIEHSEQTKINKHAVDLKLNKYLPYNPIYCLGLIELKTLKAYIKIILFNGFIYFSKSLIKIYILFV